MLLNLKPLAFKLFLHISNYKLTPSLFSSTKKHTSSDLILNIGSQFIHN